MNLKCFKCGKEYESPESYGDPQCWWCLNCLEAYLDEFLASRIPVFRLVKLFKSKRKDFYPKESRFGKINEFMPKIAEFISQNDGCLKKDIEHFCDGGIGKRYIDKILRLLVKESIIDVVSNKPKRYSARIFDATADGSYSVE